MAEPLIAILGSVDPRREKELQLRDPVMACRAAEEIGVELAKQGCRVLVSCPATPQAEFAEALVVRGYVKSGVASVLRHKYLYNGDEPGYTAVAMWTSAEAQLLGSPDRELLEALVRGRKRAQKRVHGASQLACPRSAAASNPNLQTESRP